jgi:dihydrofolate synthase/folylpolyglutamate synthase
MCITSQALDFFFELKQKLPALQHFEQLKKLDTLLNHPHRNFSCVHVAGTNGKGSVSLKIARSLSNAGYKVGLYTSPHLFFPEERIEINGKYIDEATFFNKLEFLYEFSKNHSLEQSFFNLCTMAAFLYFHEENIDVAVIETGLGGTYDATNVIDPIVSVITSIGFDHMHILGKTLDQIAHEKAGIIKKDKPVVLGPTAHQEVFLKKADETNSLLYPVSLKKNVFYDEENQNIALQTLKVLSSQFDLSNEAIQKGIQCRPRFRYEKHRLQEGQTLIFDVAHNLPAFQCLFEQIQKEHPEKSLHVVLGMSKDKDIESCLQYICKHVDALYLVPTALKERTMDIQLIVKMVKHLSPSLPVYGYETISEAIESVFKKTNSPDLIIVTGSFYIMDKAYTTFRKFLL